MKISISGQSYITINTNHQKTISVWTTASTHWRLNANFGCHRSINDNLIHKKGYLWFVGTHCTPPISYCVWPIIDVKTYELLWVIASSKVPCSKCLFFEFLFMMIAWNMLGCTFSHWLQKCLSHLIFIDNAWILLIPLR